MPSQSLIIIKEVMFPDNRLGISRTGGSGIVLSQPSSPAQIQGSFYSPHWNPENPFIKRLCRLHQYLDFEISCLGRTYKLGDLGSIEI
jgi:hypothetical protein